jgi:hypothetical protein
VHQERASAHQQNGQCHFHPYQHSLRPQPCPAARDRLGLGLQRSLRLEPQRLQGRCESESQTGRHRCEARERHDAAVDRKLAGHRHAQGR